MKSKERKKSLLDFVGKWKGSKEEADTIFNEIEERRHKQWKKRINF